MVNIYSSSSGGVEDTSLSITSCDKGPSYTSVVPLKKTTFIKYDENSYLDDYAYLAAVPTAVFLENDTLYSHPVLFYQDKQESNDAKLVSLNGRVGIDNFMDDWISYCNGQLDNCILINTPRYKVDKYWIAENYTVIKNDTPYSIANSLAFRDWSWSEDAVVAVIDEDVDNPWVKTLKHINGTISSDTHIIHENFKVMKKNIVTPVFHDFSVTDDFVFMKADAWWDGVLVGGMMIPYADPDIQLYVQLDGEWMQTSASSYWNIQMSPGYEYTQSYVYKPGTWKVGIIDFPVKGEPNRVGIPGVFEIQGSLLNTLLPGVTYNIAITKYPGVTIEIPESLPFGCKEAQFKLTWDNQNICLGFSVIGQGGEVIYTAVDENRRHSQEIYLESFSTCVPGKNYSICVFPLKDVEKPVEFFIEYSWRQSLSKKRCESLTSAVEGAVLASQINAPLLYISSSHCADETKNTLLTLGVEHVHLVNIGGRLEEQVKNELEKTVQITEEYLELETIYDSIRQMTKSNDVIFSTVDPWSYWYVNEYKPAGEKEFVVHVGPAAFLAAHHGSPVIIIDNHPHLSAAVQWHNEFWKRYAGDRCYHRPSSAEMVLTGRMIYDFLDAYKFNTKGKETIITIADQFDIGMSWDRIFAGVGYAGRFYGTPVDCAYWISRNIFYPMLIFENPSLTRKVNLTTGSASRRDTGLHLGKIKDFLKLFKREPLFTFNIAMFDITKQNHDEKVYFPVLCSFITYTHRFNERASNYHETKYVCADGLIPGETYTGNPIDYGSMGKYTNKNGCIFPDMTESEVVPFYLRKGGYHCVFSTQLSEVVDNLNNGTILWILSSHGSESDGGSAMFWNPEEGFKDYSEYSYFFPFFHPYPAPLFIRFQRWLIKQFSLPLIGPRLAWLFGGLKPAPKIFDDKNPWRGYEWFLGSTEEPDTMSIDIKGIWPYSSVQSILIPSTGNDWVKAYQPLRAYGNEITRSIQLFNTGTKYDGLIGTIARTMFPFKSYNAGEIEHKLQDMHSAGVISSGCQLSNTYLHVLLIRHGSAFQVLSPWPTSPYSAVWLQSIPRDVILGHTLGEAYAQGLSHVGILYLGGSRNNEGEAQWWWDTAEHPIYFGDPELRMYVPSTEYSTSNYWKKGDISPLPFNKNLTINGHSLFGATSHPLKREVSSLFDQFILFAFLIASVAIGLLVTFFGYKWRKKTK